MLSSVASRSCLLPFSVSVSVGTSDYFGLGGPFFCVSSMAVHRAKISWRKALSFFFSIIVNISPAIYILVSSFSNSPLLFVIINCST